MCRNFRAAGLQEPAHPNSPSVYEWAAVEKDRRNHIMKITSFNPLIVAKDPESVIQLFEALGFQQHHKKEGISEKNITGVR